MRRRLRLGLWVLGSIATLLAAVVLCVWVYSKTDRFRILLEEQTLAAIQDSINGEVSFERISGSVWRQLHFHNISIRQNGAEVISIPRLSLTFSLIRQAISVLFSSSLHIARIEIEAPLVRAAQDDTGQWNVASLFKRPDNPEEPHTVDIFLQQIKLDRGRIDARLAGGKLVQLSSTTGAGNLSVVASGVEANVQLLDFALAAEGIPTMQWRGAFSTRLSDADSTFDFRQFAVSTAASRLRGSGKLRDLRSPNLSLTLVADRIAAAELSKVLPELRIQQDFSGSLKLTGPLSALRVAGTLTFADGNLTPVIVVDLTQSEPRLQGTVDARGFAIDKVLTVAEIGGVLNGQISFDGTSLMNARADARASVAGFTIQKWQVGDLNLTANLRQQKIALDTKLTSKNGQATMAGQIALGDPLSYEANLRVRNLDVQNTAKGVSASVPITGEINLDASFKGRGTDPKTLDGSGKITVHPSRLGPVQELSGTIIGGLRGGVITLNEAKLASQGTILDARGTISAFAQTPGGKLTYNVRAQEVAPWTALAGIEAKGAINGGGSVAGSVGALTAQGKAELSNIQLPGASFQSGSAGWNLSGIGSQRPAGTIKLATRDVAAGIHLRAAQADLSLTGIEPMTIRAALVAEDREKRTHRLRGQAIYSSQSTDFLVEQLVLQLPTGIWRVAQPTGLQLRDKRITINDFLMQSGTQTMRLKGIFALEGTQDLLVQIKRFPLEDLKPFLATDPRVAGELSADVEVRGSAARPLLQSKLNVEQLSIAGQRYAGLAGEALYKDERLTVDLVLRQDASHFLTAKGGIPVYLGWGGEKSVAVLGEADLRVQSDGLHPGFLGLVNNEIENVQGKLVLDIRLHGTAQALRPTGTVGLQQAQARVKQLNLVVTGIDVQARMVPGAIQINQLSARSGEGRLTGAGKIALKDYSVADIDLAVKADDFRVANTPEYVGAVSGLITASGSQQQPFLRGTLTLTQAKLRPNLAALRQKGPPPRDPSIVVIKNEQELTKIKSQDKDGAGPQRGDDSSQPNPFYQRLGLDITAVIPHRTWVYLDEGSIELMGRLRIRKDPQKEVSITGTVESVRGWYSFQGKRFRVEKAQAAFTGGSDINPSLDVVARHNLPQYQIDLLLGGTAKKPTLTLRSDPAMEQADILATLLFGKPVAGLSEGQQTSLQAQALRTTANFVASDLRRSVAKRLGVDNLEFGFGEKVGEGRVGLGKYVTEGIYVSGTQQFGGEKQQEYSIEYNITPNWHLKGSTTVQGESGIDLFWRKRY